MSITFTPDVERVVLGFAVMCFAYPENGYYGPMASTPEEATLVHALDHLDHPECDGTHPYPVCTPVAECNFSNSNALFMLDLLGIPQDYCGTWDAVDFQQRVARTLEANPVMPPDWRSRFEAALEVAADAVDRGARVTWS